MIYSLSYTAMTCNGNTTELTQGGARLRAKPWPRPRAIEASLCVPWSSGGPGSSRARTPHAAHKSSSSAGPAVNQSQKQRQFWGSINLDKSFAKFTLNIPAGLSMFVNFTIFCMICRKRRIKTLFSDHKSMTCSSSYCVQEQSSACRSAGWLRWSISHIDDRWDTTKCWTVIGWSLRPSLKDSTCRILETGSGTGLRPLETGVMAWKVTSHFRS